MAVLPTLQDVARQAGDKKIGAIVEVLNQTNYALDDIGFMEANSGVTHRTTIRTGLPTPVWRMLNSGVPTAKSSSKQIDATCGMLEIYAEVDKAQVDLAPNGSEYIANENAAFVEGFAQEISRVMFYGDPTNPKEPVGFTHYYSKLSGAETSSNVIDAGGTGSDNSSIWFIGWGDRGAHGIYPRGSKAGLSENFKGVQTLFDADGNMFEGYRTHYKWDAGFVVRDWRQVVRACNIDMSEVRANSSDAPNIMHLFIDMVNKIPTNSASLKRAFYVPKDILTLLEKQCLDKVNLALQFSEICGKKILNFRGYPIREQESLLDSEARVV